MFGYPSTMTFSNFIFLKQKLAIMLMLVVITICGISRESNHAAALPKDFVLGQNLPNPFSSSGTFGTPATTISYEVPKSSQVVVSEKAKSDLRSRSPEILKTHTASPTLPVA